MSHFEARVPLRPSRRFLLVSGGVVLWNLFFLAYDLFAFQRDQSFLIAFLVAVQIFFSIPPIVLLVYHLYMTAFTPFSVRVETEELHVDQRV